MSKTSGTGEPSPAGRYRSSVCEGEADAYGTPVSTLGDCAAALSGAADDESGDAAGDDGDTDADSLPPADDGCSMDADDPLQAERARALAAPSAAISISVVGLFMDRDIELHLLLLDACDASDAVLTSCVTHVRVP
jgi:hypothetical protein